MYGTGTVSADRSQVIPDADPGHPGHRFGLVHFDWHGPAAPNPPDVNPSPDATCPPGATCQPPPTEPPPICTGTQSVDLSSGVDMIKATDLFINGSRGSLFISRTLRTLSTNPRPFGIGSGFNYAYRLKRLHKVKVLSP